MSCKLSLLAWLWGIHLVLTDVGKPILIVGCRILWARDSGTYKMETASGALACMCSFLSLTVGVEAPTALISPS